LSDSNGSEGKLADRTLCSVAGVSAKKELHETQSVSVEGGLAFEQIMVEEIKTEPAEDYHLADPLSGQSPAESSKLDNTDTGYTTGAMCRDR